jgi:flagellar motility protein MotE (MotC chaperone)
MTTKFIGIKEFRRNMAKLSKEARQKNVCFIVMNHSVPVMKVTPVNDREAALEQLAQDIAEARAQYKRGEWHTTDELEKLLGL